jgi:hypothetical protein
MLTSVELCKADPVLSDPELPGHYNKLTKYDACEELVKAMRISDARKKKFKKC